MTRETKVGLIVGMGVILLIGIIVSDHLSVVQQQEPALINEGLTRGSSDDRSRRVVAPRLSDGDRRSQQRSTSRDGQMMAGRSQGQGTLSRNGSSGAMSRNASGQTAQRSRPIRLPKETTKSSVASTPSTVGPKPNATPTSPSGPRKVIVVPSQPRVAVNDSPSLSQPPTLARTQLATGQESTSAGSVRSRTSLRGQSNPRSDTSTSGSSSSVVAQPVIHYVRSGQTLWQIAVQYYGDGEQWKAIAQANRDAVGSNGSVREGVRLIVPNKASLDGSVATATMSDSSSATLRLSDKRSTGSANQQRGSIVERRVSSRISSRASNGAKTVTVKTGDSLSSLAQQHLGSSDRWQDLYEANRDELDSPDHVVIGMQLRLPSEDSIGSVTGRGSRSGSGGGVTSGGISGGMSERELNSTLPKAYIVRSSDTLSSIARRELGDPNRWDDIFEANRDVLGSPDDIYVGQRLKLP